MLTKNNLKEILKEIFEPEEVKEQSFLDILIETIEKEEKKPKLSDQDRAILMLTNEVDRIARGLHGVEKTLKNRIRVLSDENSALKAEIREIRGRLDYFTRTK